MNYHNDIWITNKLTEHFDDAMRITDKNHYVGLFLQGSQNYGMDTYDSDVDTKLIVTPTLDDLIFNRKPVSYTYVRDNGEHIDVKDIRLFIDLFKKQNINIVEILFTPWYFLNPKYAGSWQMLINHNEEIGHYDKIKTVKVTAGIALEKFHALEHRYPSKIDIIDKYGYDPKQLSHLMRIESFLTDYLDGASYDECLHPFSANYFTQVKMGEAEINLKMARVFAQECLDSIFKMEEPFKKMKNEPSKSLDELFNRVQKEIITRSIKDDLFNN